MSVIFAYAMLDWGGIYQGNFENKMLRLAGTEKVNLKLMGGGFFTGGGLFVS